MAAPIPALALLGLLASAGSRGLADVAAARDLDGDGAADLLVRAEGPASRARWWAVSSRSHAVLATGSGVPGGVSLDASRASAPPRGLRPPLARAEVESVHSLGDLDGDGAPERAVLWRLGPIAVAGVHASRTGAMRRLAPTLGLDGPLVVLDDLDGDGVGEVGVVGDGSPTSGLHVFSGATGTALAFVTDRRPHARGALDVRPVPDLDGDGVGDLAFVPRCVPLPHPLAPTRPREAPTIVLVSLRRARPLGELSAASLERATREGGAALAPYVPRLELPDLFGAALAAAEDVDGDGFVELEVADPWPAHRQRWLLDGRTLEPLRLRREAPPELSARAAFARLEPVPPAVPLGGGELLRQEGHALVLEVGGAPRARFPLPADATLLSACRVARAGAGPRLVVGLERERANGTRRGVLVGLCSDGGLAFHRNGEKEHFATHVAPVGDVDADGVADVVATHFGGLGVGPHFSDGAFLLSGATGALLRVYEVAQPQPCRLALAALGDLDGDGVRDLALGQVRGLDVQGSAGRVHVISTRTGETLRTLRREDLEPPPAPDR